MTSFNVRRTCRYCRTRPARDVNSLLVFVVRKLGNVRVVAGQVIADRRILDERGRIARGIGHEVGGGDARKTGHLSQESAALVGDEAGGGGRLTSHEGPLVLLDIARFLGDALTFVISLHSRAFHFLDRRRVVGDGVAAFRGSRTRPAIVARVVHARLGGAGQFRRGGLSDDARRRPPRARMEHDLGEAGLQREDRLKHALCDHKMRCVTALLARGCAQSRFLFQKIIHAVRFAQNRRLALRLHRTPALGTLGETADGRPDFLPSGLRAFPRRPTVIRETGRETALLRAPCKRVRHLAKETLEARFVKINRVHDGAAEQLDEQVRQNRLASLAARPSLRRPSVRSTTSVE